MRLVLTRGTDRLTSLRLMVIFLLAAVLVFPPVLYFNREGAAIESAYAVARFATLLLFLCAFRFMVQPGRILWPEILIPGRGRGLHAADAWRQAGLLLCGCLVGGVMFESGNALSQFISGDAAAAASATGPFWPWLGLQPGMWLYTIFIVAIMEELCYRGIITRYCISEWGACRGLLAGALLFSGLHLFSLPSLIMAIVLAATYLSSGSLPAAIGVHASWNFLVYFALWSHSTPLQTLVGDYSHDGHRYQLALLPVLPALVIYSLWVMLHSRPANIVEYRSEPASQEGNA